MPFCLDVIGLEKCYNALLTEESIKHQRLIGALEAALDDTMIMMKYHGNFATRIIILSYHHIIIIENDDMVTVNFWLQVSLKNIESFTPSPRVVERK